MFFVWYDDNPKKSVNVKIDEAILRYKQKYGTVPNVCMVSEKTQSNEVDGVATHLGIKVRTAKTVPQNYFWIGREA